MVIVGEDMCDIVESKGEILLEHDEIRTGYYYID
jgi:hypothetical protein